MKTDELTGAIIEASMRVHTHLGPGVLESAYEACLEHELKKRGFKVDRQKELPIHYDDIVIDCGYRIDQLVENRVIIELKAVQSVLSIHHAQLLSYLRLSDKRVGLLINFHELLLKNGITRKVNNYVPD